MIGTDERCDSNFPDVGHSCLSAHASVSGKSSPRETGELSAGGRGTAWLLFIFLLASLLLLGRREFHGAGRHVDGYIEYLVAERLYHSGRLDLPRFAVAEGRRDPRVTEGVGGRHYAVFGIGQTVLYAAAISLDRGLQALIARVDGVRPDPDQPFFFAANANAFALAFAGVCLFALLARLGLRPRTCLVTTLLFVFGSTALVYGRLSFDMVLGCGLVLAALLSVVRGAHSGRVRDWALGGLMFALALMTRITSVIFAPALALYATVCWRDAWSSHRRAVVRNACGFLVPVAAAVLFLAWFNHVRFGSPFATGYTGAAKAYEFNTSLATSVPGLLFSPGRSIFVFSPLLLLGLPGVPLLLASCRREALLLLLAALTNFFFFALNRNWDTTGGWGPRFQFVLVPLLAVPAAFWFERFAERAGPARRLLAGSVGCAAVLFQLAVLAAGQPRGGRTWWTLSTSQPARVLGRFADLVRDGRWGEMNFWWLGPAAQYTPMRWLLVALFAAWVACGWTLLRRFGARAGGGHRSRRAF